MQLSDSSVELVTPMTPANHCSAEFHALLDSIDQGVLLFDAIGTVRAANTRMAHLLGVELATLQQCTGLESLIELIGPRLSNADKACARWRELHANHGEAAWDELHIAQPVRVLERFARPVYASAGQLSGWLELYRDVTSERLFESRLLQTDKMAALGQLVSGIAHELNNPLTGILGYTQLLLARQKTAAATQDQRQCAEMQKIFNEAERARRIVKNLLIFARESEPERLPVDLNEIVERTLALRSYELRVENIVVEMELTPALPQTMADPHQLQQVVLNLIVNAEHALQQQSGPRKICIRTRSQMPNRLVLEVADNGPGIAPESSTRIFDPFFTTKPAGVGTGLGLSIAYGIVKEHGGEIGVERRRQSGACFVIELPVVAPPREALQSAWQEQERRPAAREDSAARRILVVEDEPTVAQLIRDVMAEEGHHVEIFDDSQRALQRVLHAQPPLDLIICDLKMPRLDGPALYRALAAKQHPARNRILFVTGDTLSRRTLDFLESSRVPFLAKPFLVEELKLAVEQQWQAARANQASSRVSWQPRRRRNAIPPEAVARRPQGARSRPQK